MKLDHLKIILQLAYSEKAYLVQQDKTACLTELNKLIGYAESFQDVIAILRKFEYEKVRLSNISFCNLKGTNFVVSR